MRAKVQNGPGGGAREHADRRPRHVAVIMDGNGRWALARGKPRLAGHRAGAETLERMLAWCIEEDIPYLTVYAFSTENWRRPKDEVDGLMKLLALFLRTKTARLVRQGVRFRAIGRRADLPPALQKAIAAAEAKTAGGTRQLLVALSYGGRAEIVDAARALAADAAAGRFDPAALDEAAFAARLYAPDVPDPDLVIRTSGEFRLSNFLLWECAYSEFHVTDTAWPDFDRVAFDRALAAYACRDRRMGGHA